MAQGRKAAQLRRRRRIAGLGVGQIGILAVTDPTLAAGCKVEPTAGENQQPRQRPTRRHAVPVRQALTRIDRQQQLAPAAQTARQQPAARQGQQQQRQRRQAAEPAPGGTQQQLTVQVAHPGQQRRRLIWRQHRRAGRVDQHHIAVGGRAERHPQLTAGRPFDALDARQLAGNPLGDHGDRLTLARRST